MLHFVLILEIVNLMGGQLIYMCVVCVLKLLASSAIIYVKQVLFNLPCY